MKSILAIILSLLLFTQNAMGVSAQEQVLPEEVEETVQEENEQETAEEGALQIEAPSAVLMESSTGEIIFDKNGNEKLPPASVTKVMTLLLIFDAIEQGQIALDDPVTVSEYAASMGGSQVFLEPGEVQTVETMIKCIAVASANDACVAMAEHISGNAGTFVNQMNERAKGLGMNDTYFVNCNGLDADDHLTTAHDIALMSRELIVRYPQIHDYSMIWMENIVHETNKGSAEFGLSNTNKLVRHYQYATGLKTGSTSKAKFCLSATGEKDGVEMIAVIMAAPNPDIRTADAVTLLNHGFGTCKIYKDETPEKLNPLKISGGVKEQVNCEYADSFSYLSMKGEDLDAMEKKIVWEKEVHAPVKKGTPVGKLVYKLNGKEVGSVDIVASEGVKQAGYKDFLQKSVRHYLL